MSTEMIGYAVEGGPRRMFYLPYQEDPQYLFSPNHSAIEALNLPVIYEGIARTVMEDLAIPHDIETEVCTQPSNIPNTSNGAI